MWQKDKSASKKQGAFLGPRQEQIRNFGEAVHCAKPSVSVAVISPCTWQHVRGNCSPSKKVQSKSISQKHDRSTTGVSVNHTDTHC